MHPIVEIIQALRDPPFRMSQTEISRRTGIHQAKISRWSIGLIPSGADDALKLQTLLITQQAAAVKTPGEDLRPDVRWDVLRGNAAPALVNDAQAAIEIVAIASTPATADPLRAGVARRQQPTRRAAESVAAESADRRANGDTVFVRRDGGGV